MKIMVVGAGYVGLVSAVCFAEMGHSVCCLDSDPEKIKQLSAGECPIYEPGLPEMLKRALKNKSLRFSDDWASCAADAAAVFLTVGTPMSRGGSGYADLSYVFDAARSLAPHLKKFAVVVSKSTVPVGTARRLERVFFSINPGAQFEVASNPEFLREGAAIVDFMKPERVIVGTRSARSEKLLRQIYAPLIKAGAHFLNTSPESAELTKYASNAFLATKISFMNEVACLAEKLGADVLDVAKGMGLDSRIGSSFLQPGPGYGGSCFPKDTVALLRSAQEHGASMRILETVVEVNNAQKARMVRKIFDALGEDVEGKTLAVLGLTFKAGTDDMRDAPALSILPILMEKGIRVRAHDPVGMKNAKRLFPEVTFCDDGYEACEGADALCLMTDWDDYRSMNLKKVKVLLNAPVVIDLRNVFSLAAMRKEGFYYISVGRPVVELDEKKKVIPLRRAGGRKS